MKLAGDHMTFILVKVVYSRKRFLHLVFISVKQVSEVFIPPFIADGTRGHHQSYITLPVEVHKSRASLNAAYDSVIRNLMALSEMPMLYLAG